MFIFRVYAGIDVDCDPYFGMVILKGGLYIKMDKYYFGEDVSCISIFLSLVLNSLSFRQEGSDQKWLTKTDWSLKCCVIFLENLLLFNYSFSFIYMLQYD